MMTIKRQNINKLKVLQQKQHGTSPFPNPKSVNKRPDIRIGLRGDARLEGIFLAFGIGRKMTIKKRPGRLIKTSWLRLQREEEKQQLNIDENWHICAWTRILPICPSGIVQLLEKKQPKKPMMKREEHPRNFYLHDANNCMPQKGRIAVGPWNNRMERGPFRMKFQAEEIRRKMYGTV